MLDIGSCIYLHYLNRFQLLYKLSLNFSCLLTPFLITYLPILKDASKPFNLGFPASCCSTPIPWNSCKFFVELAFCLEFLAKTSTASYSHKKVEASKDVIGILFLKIFPPRGCKKSAAIKVDRLVGFVDLLESSKLCSSEHLFINIVFF